MVMSLLSDDFGQEIEHLTEDGTVYVSGEEPPPEPPETPSGLSAEAGDSEAGAETGIVDSCEHALMAAPAIRIQIIRLEKIIGLLMLRNA